MNEFMDHLTELATDPAHLAFEVLTTLVLEGLVLGLFWPIIKRAIKREHAVIDKEHGVKHDNDQDPLTPDGEHLKRLWASDKRLWASDALSDDPIVEFTYEPCGREHEPGWVCILPEGHPMTSVRTIRTRGG